MAGASKFTNSEGYTAQLANDHELKVYHKDQLITEIWLSEDVLSLDLSSRITSGDVAANQALIGADNGNLFWYNLSTQDSFQLPGHFVYTSLVKFFPSGVVGLSAGMDSSIKVWDLQKSALSTEQPPVQTLRYQRGLVDDCCLIGRGRNLISLCRADQQRAVSIWEVGAPAVVTSYAVEGANAVTIWNKADSSIHAEDLYDADGKLALVVSDSAVQILDFRQNELAPFVGTGAHHIVVNGNNLFTGTQSQLEHRDLRMADKLIASVAGPVKQLVAYRSGIAFRNDMSTYVWQDGRLMLVASDHHGVLVGGAELFNAGKSLVKF